jgi:N-hydroxyarylamine O-acetyltransferase
MDLKSYADRVGYTGDFAPTVDTLRQLHYAHATHIPFENLDILLGRPIRLDLESLWCKMVEGGRGGYCFEQNSLFSAVVEEAGFRVRRLSARVRMGSTGIRARTHMLFLAEAGGEQWLCDVGFGGDGLLHPIPFRLGETSPQFSWKYRIVQEGAIYALQSWRPEGWIDLYAFGLEPAYELDYQVASHYTSTYPTSIFRKMLRVQLPGPEVSRLLMNHTLHERTATGTTESTVPDGDGLLKVLASHFHLHFPKGTRFPIDETLR